MTVVATRSLSATLNVVGSTSRAFSQTVRSSMPSPPPGFYNRPAVTPGSTRVPGLVNKGQMPIAAPHTPPNVPENQAPNYPDTWSSKQNPRDLAMRGPRFEQMTVELQPQPLSAMEMIQREPIRLTEKRVIECDGGKSFDIKGLLELVDADKRSR